MRAFLSGEKPPAETPEHSVLLKEGWLKKEGANVKSWKQRYFKLYANRLEYYRNRHVIGPMKLKGTISLQDSGTTVVVLKGERAGYNNVFSVNLPKREYFISADSEHDRTLWIDAITAALRTLKDKTTKEAPRLAPSTTESLPVYPTSKSTEVRDRLSTGFTLSSSLPKDGPLSAKVAGESDPAASESKEDHSSEKYLQRRRSSIFSSPPLQQPQPTTMDNTTATTSPTPTYNSNTSPTPTATTTTPFTSPTYNSNTAPTPSYTSSTKERAASPPIDNNHNKPTTIKPAGPPEKPKGRLINLDINLTDVSVEPPSNNNNHNNHNIGTKKAGVQRIPYTSYSKDKGGSRPSSLRNINLPQGDNIFDDSPVKKTVVGGHREDETRQLLPSNEESRCCCTIM